MQTQTTKKNGGFPTYLFDAVKAKPRKSWPAEKKAEIVKYAEAHGTNAAAAKFKVPHPEQISKWRAEAKVAHAKLAKAADRFFDRPKITKQPTPQARAAANGLDEQLEEYVDQIEDLIAKVGALYLRIEGVL